METRNRIDRLDSFITDYEGLEAEGLSSTTALWKAMFDMYERIGNMTRELAAFGDDIRRISKYD